MIEFPKFIFIDDTELQRANVNNYIRDEFESGPSKVRPINSIPMFQVSMGIAIHKKNLKEFRQWHKSLLGGFFLLNDPFDGEKRRFRIVDNEFSWTKGGNLLRTTLVLEAYDEL